MQRGKIITLGLKSEEIESNIEKLDQVFCSLSLVLGNNLLLSWLTKGGRMGELYRKKLDLTWEHINRLGLRIVHLGTNPTLNPIQQQQKSLVSQEGGTSLSAVVKIDLRAEDRICTGIRNNIGSLQTGADWSSLTLLGEILIQREELIHQLETIFEYDSVLEHIWEDEEMNMNPGRQKPQSPMH